MLFQLNIGSIEPSKFMVLAFRGREEASADYRLDLTVAFTEAPAGLEAAALEQPASLTILSGDQPSRFIHGVVASIGWNG